MLLLFVLLFVLSYLSFSWIKERKELEERIDYESYRIDAVRLNFLIALKCKLIQDEQYEAIEVIDELLQNEFGKSEDIDFQDIWNELDK